MPSQKTTNMNMRYSRILSLLNNAVAVLAMSGVALANAAPALSKSTAFHLVKLPNGDYTIPLAELESSGMTGKVMLHPQGLKTLVTVYVFGRGSRMHEFSLKSGRDCVSASATASMQLNPALTGQPSRTIVSLPIGQLTSKNYMIDVRNAAARNRFREACASL